MKVEQTTLAGVMIITPVRHGDSRGFFSESFKQSAMQAAGLDYDWVQDNHSLSEVANTLRGLHFQTPPHAQAKLVRCGRGSLFDVAVDLRQGSATYGKWVGETLSFENGKQLLIPAGFAHGFLTLEPMTEVVYKCAAEYNAGADGGIMWDSCGIDWPLTGDPVLSAKDAALPNLADFDSPFEGTA